MNKLIVALIASAFATAAFAQGTMQKLETPKDKAKQAEVQSATQAGTTNSAEQLKKQSEEVQKLKGEKGTAKALPTKTDKSKAVQATTAAKTEGSLAEREAQAKEVQKLKGEKGTPKALATKKEKEQAVQGTTTKEGK